jgi:hypothetical protein
VSPELAACDDDVNITPFAIGTRGDVQPMVALGAALDGM